MSVTRSIDLRTGRSVWHDRRLPTIAQHTLRNEQRVDVLVIGAGVSGALVGELLTDAGFEVLLVDRRAPVRGSTAASTALLQFELDTPLSLLADRIGVDRAQRIWRRSRVALDALRERSHHLGVQADQQDRDSLYLAGTRLDRAGLAREYEARRRAGFEVVMLAPRDVATDYGLRARAALLGFGNFTADPRQLAAGFLRAAIARGAKIASPVTIASVHPTARGVRSVTTDGHVIRSRWVIFATGYELAKGVPRRDHTVSSTWAIATRPQPGRLWTDSCLIWEASDPYLYLRTTSDGRVICGGEDETFADEARRDGALPQKTAQLERKLARLCPGIDARAEYAWCGSFGTSTHGTPTIGAVPRMPHCYAVLGYGGNGITFSMLAAQLIRADLLGHRDADRGLFGFRRSW
jgi:glycine/D-amino acid oxidase-like deaminating enzyme